MSLPFSLVCSWSLLCLSPLQQQPSSQHGPIKLAWKFQEKDRFLLESQVAQIQFRRGNNQLHKDVVRANVLSSFQVIKIDAAEKTVLLEQKIEDARIVFDGTDRLNAALQADLFAKLRGSVFRITLDEEGKVKKFEGYDQVLQRITEANPAEGERFKTLVSEESLKDATEEGFGCFPNKEIKQGDTWKRAVKVPVPPAGSLKGDVTFKLASVNRGKAKITGKCESSEFEAKDGLQPGLKCDFALENRECTLLFDVEKGRLTSADFTTRYRGRILSAAGQDTLPITLLDVEIQQVVKITVRDRSR